MRWQTVQDVTVTLEKTAALGGLGSPAVTLKRYRRNVLETIPKGPDDGRLSPVPGTTVEIFVCPTTRVEWVLVPPAATREPRERGGPSSEPHGLPDSGTLTIVTEHSIEERGLLRIWASR